MNKFLMKLCLPVVKKYILDSMESDILRLFLINKISDDVVFPNISLVRRKKLVKDVAGITQETIIEYIKNL